MFRTFPFYKEMVQTKYILIFLDIITEPSRCFWHYSMWLWNITVSGLNELTHWGRVTQIYVSKLTIIGSENGLSPDWHQAIIWTNDGLLLSGPLGTNFSEILTFSFMSLCIQTVFTLYHKLLAMYHFIITPGKHQLSSGVLFESAGLEILNSWWHWMKFIWHTVRCLICLSLVEPIWMWLMEH